ncbi:unknown similar to AMEV018 [Adoxophyes honmai entomopoxvirus 'L']|uniref:Uncharacterized protein n=1 Tax=Adoxophyes honmai entomopoxvirus 'L' TaxID=1293540 RepID=A0A916NWL6_9POXV|nr:unknown similar to AMEV018 [Adoxophyes honmai entomopoxvirus 'L']CCU55347.1 unknown similar to AMEV018 [Adoxophyes honmai entomopoxvirus 'L']
MMHKILLLLLVSASSIKMENDYLDNFDKEISNILYKNNELNLGKSGVAQIKSLDGSLKFSASLYLKNGTMNILPEPSEYDVIFKNDTNKLTGFNYLTTEIFTFSSSSKLPNPNWRIQIKYTLS